MQDPGLVFHPPMLYMGYVGFAVAFAFAIAALISGRLDAAWARWSRPWTIGAWVFLTLGIALGSWWGLLRTGLGWLVVWDPWKMLPSCPGCWVPPCCILAVTEQRGSFKSWTVCWPSVLFIVLGDLLGAFGCLDIGARIRNRPRRGIFILILLVLVVGSSLTLFAWRAPKVALGGRFV